LNPIWELFELVLLWTDFEAFFCENWFEAYFVRLDLHLALRNQVTTFFCSVTD
jgi:hypothetical protein